MLQVEREKPMKVKARHLNMPFASMSRYQTAQLSYNMTYIILRANNETIVYLLHIRRRVAIHSLIF